MHHYSKNRNEVRLKPIKISFFIRFWTNFCRYLTDGSFTMKVSYFFVDFAKMMEVTQKMVTSVDQSLSRRKLLDSPLSAMVGRRKLSNFIFL
jgi:hypothetical protein